MTTQEIAREARLKTLDLIFAAQTSHVGSNFSCIDILTVLFEKADPTKDEMILSAGWKAAAWYYFLWRKGIISQDELDSFCQPESKFIGLVEPMDRWGLKVAGGSMGCGLPFAVGFALSKKLKGEEGTVYCLMSDGELAIGTTWEASLLAGKHNLDNLVVIVDDNKFCAMGLTKGILDSYFPARNWRYSLVDGHDHGALSARFDGKFFNGEGAPRLIHAETIKGFPVSFMSANNTFHYKAPSLAEYEQAMVELTNEK